MRVVFDIGHGSNTFPPSKGIYLPEGGQFAEHDFNSAVGLATKKLAEYNDIEVVFSQEPYKKDVPLTTRGNHINNEHRREPFDALVSFHANYSLDPKSSGYGVFHWHTSKAGGKLAKLWDKHAKELLPIGPWGPGIWQSKPHDWTNFYILRETAPPAILVEHFFFSNLSELKKCNTTEFIEKSAEVTVKALCEYGGKEFKAIGEEEENINKLYKVQVGSYSNKQNAIDLLQRLEYSGFEGVIVEEDLQVESKSKYYKIGDAHIIETTPDNIKIKVLGDTVSNVYGVNGTFYDTRTAPVEDPESCVFIAMNDGEAISNNAQFNGWKAPPRATLIYQNNGLMGFRQLENINPIRYIAKWAIGGFMVKPYMDFKNEKISSGVNYKTAHTYIGYDKEGKVYLIVKPNHMIRDIVPTLDKLNITHAIVLDGGGSSQLNHPDGNYRSKRKINTAILLKKA